MYLYILICLISHKCAEHQCITRNVDVVRRCQEAVNRLIPNNVTRVNKCVRDTYVLAMQIRRGFVGAFN